MYKFYFQYDKDQHKAKFVIIEGEKEQIFFVSKIVCHVPVESELNDITPKFIVRGQCNAIWFGVDRITLTNEM